MRTKNHFAHFLIEQAWIRTLADCGHHRPWSWAETYPVAKLALETRGGRQTAFVDSLFVLAGNRGSNLAFGPGLLPGGEVQAKPGNTLIAGHSGSRFTILDGIEVGDRIRLQTAPALERECRVQATQVVHKSEIQFIANSKDKRLTLVSRYPFERLRGSDELRFVMQAVAIEPVRSTRRARV